MKLLGKDTKDVLDALSISNRTADAVKNSLEVLWPAFVSQTADSLNFGRKNWRGSEPLYRSGRIIISGLTV